MRNHYETMTAQLLKTDFKLINYANMINLFILREKLMTLTFNSFTEKKCRPSR